MALIPLRRSLRLYAGKPPHSGHSEAASGFSALYAGQALVGGLPGFGLAVQIDILFQRAVDQARRPEIQHDAVGLDDARILLGATVRKSRPTIWIMVKL